MQVTATRYNEGDNATINTENLVYRVSIRIDPARATGVYAHDFRGSRNMEPIKLEIFASWLAYGAVVLQKNRELQEN
jgi:hypothetical protein